MARRKLYPEGATDVHWYILATVAQGVETSAGRNRQSVSQLVSLILEDWLRRRGELPLPEQEKVRV